jgi:hypothetical protein
MILISAIWQALVDAGVGMLPIDDQHVELSAGRHRVRLLVRAYPRPLNPSDVESVVDRYREPGLFVVPSAADR